MTTEERMYRNHAFAFHKFLIKNFLPFGLLPYGEKKYYIAKVDSLPRVKKYTIEQVYREFMKF